jgi:hypothetical protein
MRGCGPVVDRCVEPNRVVQTLRIRSQLTCPRIRHHLIRSRVGGSSVSLWLGHHSSPVNALLGYRYRGQVWRCKDVLRSPTPGNDPTLLMATFSLTPSEFATKRNTTIQPPPESHTAGSHCGGRINWTAQRVPLRSASAGVLLNTEEDHDEFQQDPNINDADQGTTRAEKYANKGAERGTCIYPCHQHRQAHER